MCFRPLGKFCSFYEREDQVFVMFFEIVRSWKLRWENIKDENRLRPLNFDIKHRPRRQDWRGELVETGMFYFARRLIIERDGVFQNEK